MKLIPTLIAAGICLGQITTGCNTSASKDKDQKEGSAWRSEGSKNDDDESSPAKNSGNFKEGSDYLLFERVRVVDKTGFDVPSEAFSLLLPKGWTQDSRIIWNGPGTSCAGTFSSISAKSADGRFQFDMFPDLIYSWNSNQQLNQFNRNNPGSSANCSVGEPMNAEQYLRNVFAGEIDNPEIVKVEPNGLVVEQMQQSNEKVRNELMQYGSANLQFDQTAINATVRWADKTEGFIVLGANVLENTVPNVYDGSSSSIFTTQISKRTVFKYPAGEKAEAEKQFALIMGSFRSNAAWTSAVNKFWRDVRQQKNVVHLRKIKMMDAQTRAIGEAAIRSGQERSNAMDAQMRSWEQRQDSQDKVHTNFIKMIRGVENYQDASGKVELSSAYNQAWSRGDGSSFIMSNNPNFDPSSVLQDQNWKEMKRVD